MKQGKSVKLLKSQTVEVVSAPEIKLKKITTQSCVVGEKWKKRLLSAAVVKRNCIWFDEFFRLCFVFSISTTNDFRHDTSQIAMVSNRDISNRNV